MTLINRFITTRSGRVSKCGRSVCCSPSININNITYSIFGMISHIGTSTRNGHYIAYVKYNDIWFKCDDNVISIFKPSAHLFSFDTAYLVFYNNN